MRLITSIVVCTILLSLSLYASGKKDKKELAGPHFVNVLTRPEVIGDGIHDDTEGLQAVLDSKVSTVYLPGPPVRYIISKALRIYSRQTLIADRTAIIQLADSACVHMLENANQEAGDSLITVTGGIWDGNNLSMTQEYHQTRNWRVPYNPKRYLGVLLRFDKVKDLHVSDLVLKDPELYGFQGGNLLRFTIENITFDYNLKRGNMDGIHIHGNSRQGRIVNLKGTTNDDLVALNADDGWMFEMSRGPIEDIQVDGLWSYNGYRAVRILSCGSPVRRVKISNIYGNYRLEAIALTNYRAHPGSTGTFEDITFDGIFCSSAKTIHASRQIWIEAPARISNLTIRDYHRTETNHPVENIFIADGVEIENLMLSGVTLVNQTGKPITFLNNQGKIGNLNLVDVSLSAEDSVEKAVMIKNSGEITQFNEVNVSLKNYEKQ